MKETAYAIRRREILFQVFDRFPNLSIYGTTKYLLKYYPEYFGGYEKTRSIIRLYRGVNGGMSRKANIDKTYFYEKLAGDI